jgi:AraC family transcriptional regulator, positive regulator of tynA and feaB
VERWRVDSRSGPRSAALWEEALAETHATFDVRLPPGDGFAGVVQRRRLGQLTLLDCRCTPFVGRRGPAVLHDGAHDQVGVQMVRQGRERAWSRGREVLLAAGDMTIWDGARPGGIEIVERFAKRTLVLPRAVVHAVCPRLGNADGGLTVPDSSAARLLARYLDALAEEIPTLDAATTAVAVDVVLDLLRAAVEPHMPAARTARREALRARARRYIRANLRDPGLGPAAVASALAVSLRTLHGSFADSGESVAGLIRSARLARSREDLESGSGDSISEIAYRWGFSEPTHFSHVFRRAFGMTPREARAAALASRTCADRGAQAVCCNPSPGRGHREAKRTPRPDEVT